MEQEPTTTLPSSTGPTAVPEPGYKKGWRPAMAWAYVAIVIFDFMIAPMIMMIMFGQAQAPVTLPYGMSAAEYTEILKALPQAQYQAWDPLTLKAGGFFHITMGVVLGIGSFTRGVEKQKRVDHNQY